MNKTYLFGGEKRGREEEERMGRRREEKIDFINK
jgi:hypothetical protein